MSEHFTSPRCRARDRELPSAKSIVPAGLHRRHSWRRGLAAFLGAELDDRSPSQGNNNFGAGARVAESDGIVGLGNGGQFSTPVIRAHLEPWKMRATRCVSVAVVDMSLPRRSHDRARSRNTAVEFST